MATIQRRRRGRGEDGDGVLAPIFAITVTMLLLVMVMEVIVNQYGRAAIQHALAEGVRAGAAQNGGAALCQQRADEVLGDLLHGSMGQNINIICTQSPDQVTASYSS